MADERTDVEIALAKEGRLLKKLTRLHEEQTLLYQQNIHDAFYEKALEFESASEKLTLNARTIPVATGRPSASMDVEMIMEKEMNVNETVLSVKGLKKKFGDLEVLRGLDLDVRNGEQIAIIGPSGCGHSTYYPTFLIQSVRQGENGLPRGFAPRNDSGGR